MDGNSPLQNHPIALETIKNNPAKKLFFQGIVRVTNKVPQIRKIVMKGTKLTFDPKLQEMIVELDCPLAAQNRCSFYGKINIKKAKVLEVATQIRTTQRFEAIRNVTRNAVRYKQHCYAA